MKKRTHPVIIRTRFAKDIVAEVCFPVRQTGKVAILAIGAPTSPVQKERLAFLAARGYVAVFARYRGTWESGGSFLERSPAQDIRDVIMELERKKSLVNIATGEKHSVKVSAVHLFGGSFGGPAVLLNTDLPIVKKVVATCPVIDWSAEGEDEPFAEFVRYAQAGYGGAYRTKQTKDWDKLIETDFYNPVAHAAAIDGKKAFIIHAKDDTIVPYGPMIPFAGKIGASYYLKPHGGHHIRITHAFLWKKIAAFLKKK